MSIDNSYYLNKFTQLEDGAIDEIDAAIYTGSTFLSKTNIAKMRQYLARWERGLQELEGSCALTD